MKDFLKGKFATALVVTATVILAGVAIFTALRLYQLRQQPVSPNAPASNPLAWDCSRYVFNVSSNGTVTADNKSTRDEPAQQAKVFINGSLVTTLNVPALPQGQSATLGTVQVPSTAFTWTVQGTRDCSTSGSMAKSCQLLAFTLVQNSPTITPTNIPGASPTNSPTPTLTSTPTPTTPPGVTLTSTPTVTPTDRPLGGTSPTPTTPPGVTLTATPTNVPGASATNSPTPTNSGSVSAVSPTPGGSTLPDAGGSTVTFVTFGLGIILVTFAMLLAM